MCEGYGYGNLTLQALSNMGILDTHVAQGPHVAQHCPNVWYPMLDTNMGSIFREKNNCHELARQTFSGLPKIWGPFYRKKTP